MTVIIPSILCLIINTLIFIHVHVSSRRVHSQPPAVVQSNTGSTQHHTVSRRDIHLLRHMIIMFCIFIGGWTPNCLIPILYYHVYVSMLVYLPLAILCELALLCDIIDLFLYNHEVRNYLKTMFLRCLQS